jgi:hypothetical protein
MTTFTRCPPGPGPAIKISGVKRGRPRKDVLPFVGTGDGNDGTTGANIVKKQRVLITASRKKKPVLAATQSVPVVEIGDDNERNGTVDKVFKGGRVKGSKKNKDTGKATAKGKRGKSKAVKAPTLCFFDDDFDDDDDDDDDNEETQAVVAVVQHKEKEVVSSSSSRRLRGSRTKVELPESTKPPTLV